MGTDSYECRDARLALNELRRPIDAERAATAARVAARRAEHAAKAAAAHAMYMAAPPLRALSGDELRGLRAPGARPAGVMLPVTPAFAGHPRTMDAILERARRYHAGPISPCITADRSS